MKKENYKTKLEDRLITFASEVILLAEKLPNSVAGKNLQSQLSRSATSPALHYGEAQDPESRADFIHKMKVGLKELRETMVCLKILDRLNYYNSTEELRKLIGECNELISIFVASCKTAKSNMQKEKIKNRKT